MTAKVLTILSVCGAYVFGIPFPPGLGPQPLIHSTQSNLVRSMPPLLRIERPHIQDPQNVFSAANQGNAAAQDAIYKMKHAPLMSLKQPKYVPAYRSLGESGQRKSRKTGKVIRGEKENVPNVARLIIETSQQLIKLTKILMHLIDTHHQ